jgi:hypothetical protein
MRRAKLLKHVCAGLALQVVCGLWATPAAARKLSAGLGFFSVNAKTQSSSASLSGVGAYQIAYEHPLAGSVDLRLGYSLLMTRGIGGDLSFGLDLGGSYYPLTRSSAVEWSSEQARLLVQELWRPYVGAGFFQRNFQSLQSGFAGFGGWAGVDRAIQGPLSARFEARYLSLSGPKSSRVSQVELSIGALIGF